jgi:hypothetical protein
MDGHQTLTLEQLQTVEGVAKLNDMLRGIFRMGRHVAFIYSLSASTSADAYAKWGETQGTSTIGLRMSSPGSVVHHSCLMNITTATSGDVTAEIRVNDTNQSNAEIEFNSSLGTGVASDDVLIDRHAVSFSDGDLIQAHLNLTGTMTWASVVGFIEVVFDE